MVFVKIEGMLFFIVTFHQIVFYSLCFGRSWLLIHLMLKLIAVGVALGGLAARFNTSHVKVNLTNNIIKQHDPVSFNTSHVKVNPTYFLHSIQYTIPDSPVFINVFKIFTSHRAICQKNLQNHRNATVFADSRNFALIGGW